MGAVADAIDASLATARHLTDLDKGAVEALRVLAVKIDQAEERWEQLRDFAEIQKLKPPPQDNVSIPTLLKFCESLGLTPAGRVKLGPVKEGEGGKLAKLRSVQAGESA